MLIVASKGGQRGKRLQPTMAAKEQKNETFCTQAKPLSEEFGLK